MLSKLIFKRVFCPTGSRESNNDEVDVRKNNIWSRLSIKWEQMCIY